MALCERLTAYLEPLVVDRLEHVEEIAELGDVESAQLHRVSLRLGQGHRLRRSRLLGFPSQNPGGRGTYIIEENGEGPGVRLRKA